MYPLYRDIRDRLGVPIWHDQHGVPRYDEFHPSLLGIHDDWACHFLVRCPSCGEMFPCAVGFNALSYIASQVNFIDLFDKRSSPEEMLPCFVGWGDAPYHPYPTGQCAGTTMGADVCAILSVWYRDSEWGKVEISLGLANSLCGYDHT